MKLLKKVSFSMKCNRGAAAVIVGVMLVGLFGFAALAIDIGLISTVKNELQNAADASALAAAGQLGDIYSKMSYEEQQVYVCNPATIAAIAQEVAGKNYAGSGNITINPADVRIGRWAEWRGSPLNTRVQNLNQPDAVTVVARRDDQANGPINTIFAKALGRDNSSVTAFATAALTGQSTAEPGELELPIGVSRKNFPDSPPNGFCGEVIEFSPTTDPDACAGWTTFTDAPANNQKVKKILEGLTTSPFVYAGETEFQFINGDLSEGTFEELMKRYQERGYAVDRVYDPDNPTPLPQPVHYMDGQGNYTDPFGNPLPPGADPIPIPGRSEVPLCEYAGHIEECLVADLPNQLQYPPCQGASGCNGELRYAHEWETTVVVYDSDDCTPGKDMLIKGFAKVVVYNVGYPSNKMVAARIKCDIVDPLPHRGGGGEFGILGSIPGLVE